MFLQKLTFAVLLIALATGCSDDGVVTPKSSTEEMSDDMISDQSMDMPDVADVQGDMPDLRDLSEDMASDMADDMVRQRVSGCDKVAESGVWSMSHDGRTREVVVHIPSGYDAATPTPVVMNYHGRNMTAQGQADLSKMNALADREGFIVVYPQGVGNSWNVEVCCEPASFFDVDDVSFSQALLDTLNDELCVDPERVYLAGFSNGGMMANRVACALGERVAAVASVAGPLVNDCVLETPMAALHIHGTADLVVPYGGNLLFPSATGAFETWRQSQQCLPLPNHALKTDDVLCEQWNGCQGDVQTQMCRVELAGHQWPGGVFLPGFGLTTSSLDASEWMWSFFSRYSKPQP